MKNQAFTLIELLVVVLIIGILAAIALPQYRKAVVKSKYGTLKSLTRSLYEAEKVYILQNGTWATSFKDLDLFVSGNFGSGNHTNNTVNFDGNKQCIIEDTYIYCHDYYGIGMAYLIIFEEGQHYCVSATPGDNIPTQICKDETGNDSINGYWYRYN